MSLHLKTETFYLQNRRKYNKDSITNIVKNYITFYNETRIQYHLKNQSLVQFRKLVFLECFSSVSLLRCSVNCSIFSKMA
ncbi:IS3 family transposase [Streptococcus halichoeri]|uniref:IS3 family transposase n=1 Tax=Streptococcus halichoeri TaxID=254785 RepID=UPI00135728D2